MGVAANDGLANGTRFGIRIRPEITARQVAAQNLSLVPVLNNSLQATSTVDSPLWAKGNIAIKGKAKVALNGEYPSGCNGNLTVYEAEIDAKNTSQNNIPALSDCPTINDDFELTYAMAVDSEGTSIDLIEHDGAEQAKGFLHLYKNIHFITGEKTVT